VSNRPARITRVEIERAIRAAKQAGADSVEIRPDGSILVHISPQLQPQQQGGEPAHSDEDLII
jgi:hypothetical protein